MFDLVFSCCCCCCSLLFGIRLWFEGGNTKWNGFAVVKVDIERRMKCLGMPHIQRNTWTVCCLCVVLSVVVAVVVDFLRTHWQIRGEMDFIYENRVFPPCGTPTQWRIRCITHRTCRALKCFGSIGYFLQTIDICYWAHRSIPFRQTHKYTHPSFAMNDINRG